MGIRLKDFYMEYQDKGTGARLLLIHGFPLNSAMWQPQIDDLSGVARVIAPDLRGFGASEPVPGAYTMDMLANDCLQLLDDIALKQPVTVAGLSMGGYIALAFQRLFPEHVEALILTATRSGADTPEGKANRDKTIAQALEFGPDSVARSMLPKLLSPKNYENQPDLVASLLDIMESNSTEGIVGASYAMKERQDSTPLLPLIDKPVLILHGAEDQLIPVEQAEAMQAAIPNSRLQVLPDAGHMLNLEQPELFNQAVREFIESL